jgi:uncharacterized membrane protein (UPF0127 family)
MKVGDFSNYTTANIHIHNRYYTVFVAKSYFQILRGLSKITKIPDGFVGMLFVFKKITKMPFTTKHMKFYIDLFFLDENYNIIESHLNLKPGIKKIIPQKQYKYALETESGLLF